MINNYGEMLSYEGFSSVILSQMRQRLSDRVNPEDIRIEKKLLNNDTMTDSLNFHVKGSSCMPSVRLGELYDAYVSGERLEDIVDDLGEIYNRSAVISSEVMSGINAALADGDAACRLLEFRLINRERNRGRLDGCLYRELGEFALSYYLKTGISDQGWYSLSVTDDMCEAWGMTEDELYDIAMDNMNLSQCFRFQQGGAMDPIGEENPMFILTSAMGINGATVIVSRKVREKVAEYLNDDYYILPSSVHELIIIPKKKASAVHHLVETVRSVNRSDAVPEGDFLSDNVYEYCRSTGEIRLAC
ncbi:MAG: DUF5688 family protein [Clostridiales bacterium]|nr:DUF5688 family protein [Clostridiales bacterium]MDD7035986.1 DUF5688 family protein [Bacillota bacterium]MDY2921121.1 DUF5688 family protein [Lentihominibacter sp.]